MLINPITQQNNYTYTYPNSNTKKTAQINVRQNFVSLPSAYYPVMKGNQKIEKSIQPKIESGINSLLKKITSILETEPKELDKDFILEYFYLRCLNKIKYIEKQLDRIKQTLSHVVDKYNDSQRRNIKEQARKEYNQLVKKHDALCAGGYNKEKAKLLEEILNIKEPDEDYDYPLINKFKTAVQDGNLNLDEIFKEHYQKLSDITTVEELRKLYPSIQIPPKSPQEVIAEKYINVLTRDFYEKISKLGINNVDETSRVIVNKILELSQNIDCGSTISSQSFIKKILPDIVTCICQTCFKGTKSGGLSNIPVERKIKTPQVTPQDIKMLSIDYDKFVLSVVKDLYLNDKKPDQISYIENGTAISLSDLKSTDYKFAKLSEKVKSLVKSAREIKELKQNYNLYSIADIQKALEELTAEEYCNNEKILSTILEFQYCDFIGQDIVNVKKLLAALDELKDGKKSVENVVSFIEKENIQPHDTNKKKEFINNKKLEETKKIQAEKQQIHNINKKLEATIALLYANGMNSVAQICSTYKITSLDNEETELINNISKFIETNINTEQGKKHIEQCIMKAEAYRQMKATDKENPDYINAIKYASDEKNKVNKIKAGQYILNADMINGLDKNIKIGENAELAEKLVKLQNVEREQIIEALCKYEDFISAEENSGMSLSEALTVFNPKNALDKTVLKHFIETKYIHNDTVIKLQNYTKENNSTATITAEAKQAILDSRMFPACIEYYEAFESACKVFATKENSSGIKRTGTNNNMLAYNIEVKIIGYKDRLFSSQNNYVFDIYSENGYHK